MGSSLSKLFWLVLALGMALACPAWAQGEKTIPPESLAKLQDVFGRVNELLWQKSDVYFHEGYHERDIATLRIITELDPTDMEAFSVGAWLMDSRDRPGDAQAYLQLGLALNPDKYDLYAELGQFFYGKKDYVKAVDYFEKASKFKEFPVVMWHMLAHAYERSGQLEKSLQTWERSATLEPGDSVVSSNLERVKREMKNEK